MFTKILTSTLLFLVAIGGFFVSDYTFATVDGGAYALSSQGGNIQQTTAANTSNVGKVSADMKEMYNKLVTGLNIILTALSFVVMPAIILASWLMSPDWTSGDAFGLRDIMHDIWIIVSNIIYFVYAILLIIIALATIFGKESFSYNSMLPKLALGILMVPFTWWFVQWTISLSTVVTASVITIPAEVMDSKPVSEGAFWTTPSLPRDMVISGTGAQSTFTASVCPGECISPKDFYKEAGGIWSPLVIYGYGIFKFQEVKQLEKWDEGLEGILQLVHQGIFGAIMFLVFGILIIALIFILMTRAIKLWVYAMFSPLFTLHFVAGKELMGKMGDGDDTFSIKEFIGLCFVPAIIGMTLSFGLIVLSAVMTPPTQPSSSTTFTMFGNPGSTITSSPDGKNTIVEFGGMKTTFAGVFGGSSGAGAGSSLNSIFGTIGSFFGTIIIDIIALIFVWSAFMAAKGVNKAVAGAVKPFEEMGQSIGGLAKSLPKYTPIPFTGGMSMDSVGRATSGIKGALDANSSRNYEKSELGQFVAGLNPTTKIDEKDMEKLRTILGKSGMEHAEALQTWTKDMKNKGNGEAIYSNADSIKQIEKFTAFAKDANINEMKNRMNIKQEMAERLKAIAKDDKIDPRTKTKMIAALLATGDYHGIKDAHTATEALKGGGTTSNPGTGGSNGGFTATQATRSDNIKEVKITMGDSIISVVDGKISEADLKELKEKLKGKWPKAEFDSKIEPLGGDLQKIIKDAISGEKDWFKKDETKNPA